MNGCEIGIVLARASELRSKFTNYTDKGKKRLVTWNNDKDENEEEIEAGVSNNPLIDEEGISGGESQSFFNILDAIESLEKQLISLQALHQEQQYERELNLAQIDHSRQILLKKLKEYKGDDLEVLHETFAFASETVEHNLEVTHEITSLDTIHHTKRISEVEKEQSQSRSSPTGLRILVSVAAKTVITLISVGSILSIAGFEPSLRRRNTNSMVLKNSIDSGKMGTIHCPPGKVLVIEDGEPRCLVKERIEIPFQSVVTTRDVNLGCG